MAQEANQVQRQAVREHQNALETYFRDDLASSIGPAKFQKLSHKASPGVRKEIHRLLTRPRNTFSGRKDIRPRLCPVSLYNAFLRALYTPQPEAFEIIHALGKLPHPSMLYIHARHLEDLISLAISLFHTSDRMGKLLTKVIDELDEARIPASPFERASYILAQSRGKLNRASIAAIHERMIRWNAHFVGADIKTLNTLLAVAKNFDSPELKKFVDHELPNADRQTMKLLVDVSASSLASLSSVSLSPDLLLFVLKKQLESGRADAAQATLSRICAQNPRTAVSASTNGPALEVHLQAIDTINKVCEPQTTISLPLVPHMALFETFLRYHVRHRDFPNVLRILVSMANHGCFPARHDLYAVMKEFDDPNTSWTHSDLDQLLHYMCDISLHYKFMSTSLATRIFTVYRKYDPSISKDLLVFFLSLVEAEPAPVPCKTKKLTKVGKSHTSRPKT